MSVVRLMAISARMFDEQVLSKEMLTSACV